MQPNVITLSVDEENDGVGLVQVEYVRAEQHLNRTLYHGPGNSFVARDLLGLYRTMPKASGNFRGTFKCAVKMTHDIVVLGVDGVAQITSPIIQETSFSIPVGALHADILKLRQRKVSLLDLDTVMDVLVEEGLV